jgi:predicted dehydrogenase/nucleoside-diphosphate-sugar epimerase
VTVSAPNGLMNATEIRKDTDAPVESAAAPLRVAILGGGAVTAGCYLPAFRMLTSVQLAAVVDPSPASAARLVEAGYAGPLEAIPYQQFLADPKRLAELRPDAVVVALPNALHEEATVAALEHGFHVLCEKPLALTEAACRRIQEAADRAGRVAAVGMARRFLPSVAALREALELVGEVRQMTIEDGAPFCWPSDSGAFFRPESGGVLADMGVHYLDLVRMLFGPLRPLSYCDDWRGGCEANCEFHLETDRGVAVHLRLSRDRLLQNEMLVAGEKGQLAIKKDDFAACFWSPANAALRGRLEPRQAFPEPRWPATLASCFACELREFERAVRGLRPPHATVAEAIETVRLIEWAYADRKERPFATPTEGADRPALPPSPVVVTGGTGFIGGRLVERLAELACAPLVVPVRNYQSCVGAARFPVAMPRVDLLSAESVRKAVQGARFVFHLAYGREGPRAKRVTVEGTRHVVEAAVAVGAECVVVLSTMHVFGYPDTDEPVDETWPYAPVGAYGRSKAAMERWCLARAARSGATRIVVLNPTCVYGPGGKTYTRLPAELAKEGAFCFVNGGAGVANYTYVDNLIDAVLLAARCEQAHGKRMIINDGCCSWREFLTPLLGPRAAGVPSLDAREVREQARSGRRAGVRDLLRAAARSPELVDVVNRLPLVGPTKRWLLDRFPHWRTRFKRPSPAAGTDGAAARPPLPPDWLADLFGPTRTRFSSALARRLLGWEPRVPLAEGQARAAEWLRDMGLFC